jgi:hypothetical protein
MFLLNDVVSNLILHFSAWKLVEASLLFWSWPIIRIENFGIVSLFRCLLAYGQEVLSSSLVLGFKSNLLNKEIDNLKLEDLVPRLLSPVFRNSVEALQVMLAKLQGVKVVQAQLRELQRLAIFELLDILFVLVVQPHKVDLVSSNEKHRNLFNKDVLREPLRQIKSLFQEV